MVEELDLSEDEAVTRAMAISETEEHARWIGLDVAIKASQ
jgi:hypothetical protein